MASMSGQKWRRLGTVGCWLEKQSSRLQLFFEPKTCTAKVRHFRCTPSISHEQHTWSPTLTGEKLRIRATHIDVIMNSDGSRIVGIS